MKNLLLLLFAFFLHSCASSISTYSETQKAHLAYQLLKENEHSNRKVEVVVQQADSTTTFTGNVIEFDETAQIVVFQMEDGQHTFKFDEVKQVRAIKKKSDKGQLIGAYLFGVLTGFILIGMAAGTDWINRRLGFR